MTGPKSPTRFLTVLALMLLITSCAHVDLFEKTAPIPKHQWQAAFKPSFSFTVTDTASPYQVFIILRHSDRYNYNNIWVNLYTQAPGDTIHKVQYELPLASKEKGWLGAGMDDIFEHRISISPPELNRFPRAGTYTFTLEQVMREDPLAEVLDVGIRLEKKR